MVYEDLGKNIKLRRLHEFASNSSSKSNNSLQLTLFCFLFRHIVNSIIRNKYINDVWVILKNIVYVFLLFHSSFVLTVYTHYRFHSI